MVKHWKRELIIATPTWSKMAELPGPSFLRCCSSVSVWLQQKGCWQDQKKRQSARMFLDRVRQEKEKGERGGMEERRTVYRKKWRGGKGLHRIGYICSILIHTAGTICTYV